jgi:hypothetical protein
VSQWRERSRKGSVLGKCCIENAREWRWLPQQPTSRQRIETRYSFSATQLWPPHTFYGTTRWLDFARSGRGERGVTVLVDCSLSGIRDTIDFIHFNVDLELRFLFFLLLMMMTTMTILLFVPFPLNLFLSLFGLEELSEELAWRVFEMIAPKWEELQRGVLVERVPKSDETIEMDSIRPKGKFQEGGVWSKRLKGASQEVGCTSAGTWARAMAPSSPTVLQERRRDWSWFTWMR